MIGQNKLRESEIADKWALAMFNKDPDGVAAARDMLRDWNEKNPLEPIGIQMPQIIKRVRAMMESKQERIAKTSPKEIRATVRRELAGQ